MLVKFTSHSIHIYMRFLYDLNGFLCMFLFLKEIAYSRQQDKKRLKRPKKKKKNYFNLTFTKTKLFLLHYHLLITKKGRKKKSKSSLKALRKKKITNCKQQNLHICNFFFLFLYLFIFFNSFHFSLFTIINLFFFF